MRRHGLAGVFVFLLGWIGPALAEEAELSSLPRGKGLPVVVRVGLAFVNLAAVDENAGTFSATVDLRLRWQDLRLAYPAAEAPGGFKEYRSAAADARLEGIWAPQIGLGNALGDPSAQTAFSARGLRVYPDGRVELMQRATGQFSTPFDVERFPFDRQKLGVELVSMREEQSLVTLDFRQDDLEFSRAAEGVEADGWSTGIVELRRDARSGWYGATQARVRAALTLARRPGASVASIFIPLLASLLIPLLALWLNKVEDAEFQVEAFELANIIIGGLFAVIALNFTVSADYGALASGDNVVTRLFALNYLTLAASLLINIALFRFNLLRGMFGKYVQEQVYLFFVWAVPLLVFSSAAAILLLALV